MDRNYTNCIEWERNFNVESISGDVNFNHLWADDKYNITSIFKFLYKLFVSGQKFSFPLSFNLQSSFLAVFWKLKFIFAVSGITNWWFNESHAGSSGCCR